jgi:predicted nucleic-acid-binding protein
VVRREPANAVIGLDTNVIVRYLAQDDPVQFAAARRMIEHELSEENPGFISTVVIAEAAWVLERSYDLTNVEIADVIEVMLQASTLVIDCEHEVFAAAVTLRNGDATFADALIGELGARAGCTHTLTFDRRAARLPKFQVLR